MKIIIFRQDTEATYPKDTAEQVEVVIYMDNSPMKESNIVIGIDGKEYFIPIQVFKGIL